MAPNNEPGEMPVVNVVVVDDNDAFRSNLVSFVQQHDGFKVVGEAGDGREAVRLARTLQPDLMLMDITMPIMSGYAAALEIRRNQLSENIKIVFITIHSDQTYQALASIAQVNGYVCKSSLKRDLPSVLERVRAEIVGPPRTLE